MKKILFIYIFISFCAIPSVFSQTLNEAKEFYLKGEYAKALPIFRNEVALKPTDAALNQWFGVCLLKTGGDIIQAEESLQIASKKKLPNSFLALGELYTLQYRFTEAFAAFDSYESFLKKNDTEGRKVVEAERKKTRHLQRMISNTEDVQIIDSLVLDKSNFLAAYKMSGSSGNLDYFKSIFKTDRPVESTVYFNEKKSKIYFAQPDTTNTYSLYSMEKLIDDYGNEKKLSPKNFGLIGNLNYPFVMPDGLTIYFAAQDADSFGGYDIFVSRYNTNSETYLVPERLTMPFNSDFNDYLMVVDEEKGIGWFASDRFQAANKVCVYTFIPNKSVKMLENLDEKTMVSRAFIKSIKDTWREGIDYSKTIALARKETVRKETVKHDFEFVINDDATYRSLSNFKNKNAQDAFLKILQLRGELKTLIETLEKDRQAYASADMDGKKRMSSSLLIKEKRLEQLQSEIPTLEIQARKLENSTINRK